MTEPTALPPTEPTASVPPAAAATVQPQQTPAQGRNDRRGPPHPGDRGPRKPLPPRGERPKFDGTKPPQLEHKDFAALRPNKRDLDDGLEAELNAALGNFDVTGTTVAEAKQKKGTGTQTKKRGQIVGIHGKDVFVEVPGGRSQGVLPLLQFGEAKPKLGEFVEFDIEGYDGSNGLLKLTMTGSSIVVTDWSSIARGMIVEAKVTGVNKNGTGLLVEVNGIKGFMPISQIDMYRVEKPEDYINQKLKCVVNELDVEERNLVLSRRALLEREKAEKAEKFWATVEEGQTRTGIVRSIKPFGAFVDLDGAADGLIPVSELSWNRIGDPSEIVSLGQKVEVVVARLDFETRKIGLSLKQLIRSPWDDFAEANKTGARLTGKVTRIEDFGAFVEVSPGIEGLVHISEMATMRIRRVREAVTEGQEITVQILSMDVKARRMSLSLKALLAEAESAEDAKDDAEKEADRQEAEARMIARKMNPNLRGGIGSGKLLIDTGE